MNHLPLHRAETMSETRCARPVADSPRRRRATPVTVRVPPGTRVVHEGRRDGTVGGEEGHCLCPRETETAVVREYQKEGGGGGRGTYFTSFRLRAELRRTIKRSGLV